LTTSTDNTGPLITDEFCSDALLSTSFDQDGAQQVHIFIGAQANPIQGDIQIRRQLPHAVKRYAAISGNSMYSDLTRDCITVSNVNLGFAAIASDCYRRGVLAEQQGSQSVVSVGEIVDGSLLDVECRFEIDAAQ
jgi:hypothetical protein